MSSRALPGSAFPGTRDEATPGGRQRLPVPATPGKPRPRSSTAPCQEPCGHGATGQAPRPGHRGLHPRAARRRRREAGTGGSGAQGRGGSGSGERRSLRSGVRRPRSPGASAEPAGGQQRRRLVGWRWRRPAPGTEASCRGQGSSTMRRAGPRRLSRGRRGRRGGRRPRARRLGLGGRGAAAQLLDATQDPLHVAHLGHAEVLRGEDSAEAGRTRPNSRGRRTGTAQRTATARAPTSPRDPVSNVTSRTHGPRRTDTGLAASGCSPQQRHCPDPRVASHVSGSATREQEGRHVASSVGTNDANCPPDKDPLHPDDCHQRACA